MKAKIEGIYDSTPEFREAYNRKLFSRKNYLNHVSSFITEETKAGARKTSK